MDVLWRWCPDFFKGLSIQFWSLSLNMYLDKQILLKICQISPLQILTCLGANTRKLRIWFYFACKFCVDTNPILVSEESFQLLKKTKIEVTTFSCRDPAWACSAVDDHPFQGVASPKEYLFHNLLEVSIKCNSKKKYTEALPWYILCFEVSFKNI